MSNKNVLKYWQTKERKDIEDITNTNKVNIDYINDVSF